MTVFVTGGTSSIGRVLVAELAGQGKSVRILARQTSNLTGLERPGVEFINLKRKLKCPKRQPSCPGYLSYP